MFSFLSYGRYRLSISGDFLGIWLAGERLRLFRSGRMTGKGKHTVACKLKFLVDLEAFEQVAFPRLKEYLPTYLPTQFFTYCIHCAIGIVWTGVVPTR